MDFRVFRRDNGFWARMGFKPTKPRSLVLKKGIATEKVPVQDFRNHNPVVKRETSQVSG